MTGRPTPEHCKAPDDDYTSSHPTPPARFIGMEEAVAEVHQKIEADAALRLEIRASSEANTRPSGSNPYRSTRDN